MEAERMPIAFSVVDALRRALDGEKEIVPGLAKQTEPPPLLPGEMRASDVVAALNAGPPVPGEGVIVWQGRTWFYSQMNDEERRAWRDEGLRHELEQCRIEGEIVEAQKQAATRRGNG